VTVYVDTSALYALADVGDNNHGAAVEAWSRLIGGQARLLTTNYVLVEVIALMRARSGLQAVNDLASKVLPVLTTIWVDEDVHNAGCAAMLASGRNGPSLVDCVGFEVVRRHSVDSVFAYDRHFRGRGADTI
jgi:predicted nucleic acid-binding protein